MALSKHKSAFVQFIKKFVRHALTETLKIPDQVLFGGESPFESLLDAVQFWRDWLNQETIWSEFNCAGVYDEVINRILEDIEALNLSYRIEKTKDGLTQYNANNSTDQ